MKITATATTFALLAVGAMAASRGSSRTKTDLEETHGRRLMGDMMDGKGGGKGGMKGTKGLFQDSCPTCEEQLPGFSFFGPGYSDIAFTSIGDDKFGEFLDFDLEDAQEQRLDFISSFGDEGSLPLLAPFGFADFACVPNVTVGSSPSIIGPPTPATEARFGFCKLLALISQIIYNNDVTRCLLTSTLKTLGDATCYLLDVLGFPNGELPGSGLYPSGIDILKIIDLNTTITLRGRQLEEGKRRQLAPLDIIDLKADSFESLLPGLFETGLTASTLWAELITNGDIAQITEALSTMMGTTDEGRRHLQDCLDDNGLIDCLVDFFITPEVTQAIQANSFFLKCTERFDLPFFVCASLFTVIKTEAAVLCDYEESCDIATECTANLKFVTEQAKRNSALFTPGFLFFLDPIQDVSNFAVAEILGACSPCALSNECAPFCNYLEKYHECDPARRLSLAIAAATFVTVEITPTPPKPAHNGRNLEERLVGPANF